MVARTAQIWTLTLLVGYSMAMYGGYGDYKYEIQTPMSEEYLPLAQALARGDMSDNELKMLKFMNEGRSRYVITPFFVKTVKTNRDQEKAQAADAEYKRLELSALNAKVEKLEAQIEADQDREEELFALWRKIHKPTGEGMSMLNWNAQDSVKVDELPKVTARLERLRAALIVAKKELAAARGPSRGATSVGSGSFADEYQARLRGGNLSVN